MKPGTIVRVCQSSSRFDGFVGKIRVKQAWLAEVVFRDNDGGLLGISVFHVDELEIVA